MRKLSEYLNPTLSALYEKTEHVEALQADFQTHLPEALKALCFVSSYQAGNLVISVADPIYLTPLRYRVPELRNQLRLSPVWHDLVSIQLKVQPLNAMISQRVKPQHVLSTFVCTFLVEASQKIVYTPLSNALQRLARKEKP